MRSKYGRTLFSNLGRKEHTMPCLIQLHWLPVSYRIKYKLCILMHNIRSGRAASGLAELYADIIQQEHHALVCAFPLQRPPATLHLGCTQLLENRRFLFWSGNLELSSCSILDNADLQKQTVENSFLSAGL